MNSQVVQDAIIQTIADFPGLTKVHVIAQTARTLGTIDEDVHDIINGLVRNQQIIELTYYVPGTPIPRTRYFPGGSFFSFKGKA